MLRRLTLMALIALLALAGCQRDEDEQAETTADESRTEAMFRHVPADTPYLFANLQPTPEPVLDTTFRALEEMGKSMQVFFDAMIEEADDPDEREQMQAVFGELRALMSRDGFREAGLREDSLYALYAQGMLPVMRLEVADPLAVAETIGRLETAADMTFPRQEHDGQEYWWIPLGEKMGALAAVVDNQLVAGLTTGAESEITAILGGTTPDDTYPVDDFSAFNSDLGYTDYGSGFVRLPALLARIMNADDPQFGWLHDDPEFGAIAGNEDCRNELGALFDIMPRMVSGATHVDAERINSHARLEIRDDYAKRLMAVVDTPLDLSDDPGSVVNFGMAINIVNLRDFLREEVDRLAGNMPQCPLFARLNEDIADIQAGLNRPIPPVVTNLHGFKLRLASADVVDGKVDNVSASFALAMRNPQLLLGMAQMFSPQLSELNLTPGGDPQPLPEGTVPDMDGIPTDQVFIAMSDGALGIAMGEDEKDRLGNYLKLSSEGGGAFMSFAMDTAGYSELIQAATQAYGENVLSDMHDETSMDGESDTDEGDTNSDAAGQEDMAELFESQPSMDFMSSLYTRYFSKIRFTDQGIEIAQDAELNQPD